VHQQPGAQAQAGLGEQGVVGGGEHLGEAAGLGPAEPVGDGHGDTLVDHRQLGLAPPTTAITRSPTPNRVASGPTLATSPASSSPGMSGGLPGGAG
jgi:hypothetical protein